jgi:hypothetical protein
MILVDYNSIVSNNDKDKSYSTIAYFFAGIATSDDLTGLSFRKLQSFMALKYTSEASFVDYKKEPAEFIYELLGINLRSYTPLMLTKSRSPFREVMGVLCDSDKIFLRQPDNLIPYAMLWEKNTIIEKNTTLSIVDSQINSIRDLVLNCALRSITDELNLMLVAVPGWSYDSFCEERLSMDTRKKFTDEKFVYNDRILDQHSGI